MLMNGRHWWRATSSDGRTKPQKASKQAIPRYIKLSSYHALGQRDHRTHPVNVLLVMQSSSKNFYVVQFFCEVYSLFRMEVVGTGGKGKGETVGRRLTLLTFPGHVRTARRSVDHTDHCSTISTPPAEWYERMPC